MEPNFKIVSIYADLSNSLFIIPNSRKEIRGVIGGAIAEMDDVIYITYPYSDDAVEDALYEALAQCHKEEPKWPNGLGPMEQFLNVRGYEKAVKNKKYVQMCWDTKDGYKFIPTEKVPKQGYKHQDNMKIYLGEMLSRSDLANGLKKALEVSTF